MTPAPWLAFKPLVACNVRMLGQTFHSFSRDAMGTMPVVALHAAMLLFAVAALLALAALMQVKRVRPVWADWAGALATISLVGYFVLRLSEAGVELFSSLFEVVALSALFLALAYFLSGRVRRMRALGAFAYPAITIIFLVNLLFAGSDTDSGVDAQARPLLVLHVVLVLLSYAAFFMATVAAIMSLLLERALKQHRDPAVIRNFPPLESLRRLVHTCILIGLPLLTVGLALGFGALSTSSWVDVLTNPKIPPSLVLWGVMVCVATGRWAGFLRGRRHLYLVLVGFLLVISTYVGLGMWARAQSADSPSVSARIAEAPCTAT